MKNLFADAGWRCCQLRRWETGGSHGLLADRQQWSPPEDSEDLHVSRAAETCAFVDHRVPRAVSHGSNTQDYLKFAKYHREISRRLIREGDENVVSRIIYDNLKLYL